MSRGVALVTGAAGLVGARTAAFLLDDAWRVVGADNLNSYYDVRLKRHRLESLRAYANFSFAEVDIEDTSSLSTLFQQNRFEVVYNLAARAGVRYSMENPHIYLRTNAHGTLHLLEEMRQHACPHLVLASTSSLYAGEKGPFVETMPVNRPISPYAASKKAAEAMAYTYSFLYGINVAVLRYFTVYGPAGRPDMAMLRFVRWIDEGSPIALYGDGTQDRDFTFVDDVAKGTVAASQIEGYEIINLGNGSKPVTLMRVIELIEEAVGKKAVIDHRPAHPADMDSTSADIAKARRLLGWEPEVDIREGIEQTVRWYRENESLVRSLQL